MTPQQKIRYLQAYIHHMKGKRVEISLPQTVKHALLMDQAYQYAVNNMTKLGKKINV